jgi:2-methylisocitrate lyase-like PEP mutase family enzyme
LRGFEVTSAARLRETLSQPEIVLVPGAADALTARIVERAGFPAVYATGAGFANASLALPDIGLVSVDAVVCQVQQIADAVSIPVIADADTGYGGVLNTYRTFRRLERAGAAAIQLEDQVEPKRCGHFAGKAVVALDEMIGRLRAALDARTDPDVLLIARTDARSPEGFDRAVERAQAYAREGADMIFVEAPHTVDELQRLPQLIEKPLIANVVEGGLTPVLNARQLGSFGFRVALYANTALRVSAFAVQQAMAILREDCGSERLQDRMLTWHDRQDFVELTRWQEREDAYLHR